MTNGKRLLFFDFLRIGSIAAIVFCHITQIYHWSPFCDDPLIFHIFHANIGVTAVAIMIFVSGAVLEYTHPNLTEWNNIIKFYIKRICRIYPAFWIAMIFGLLLSPSLIKWPPFSVFLQFIGFYTWGGQVYWGGPINGVSWFIGLIVSLYLVYPYLSASIKKYPYQMLVLIAFIEVFFRYTLNVINIPSLGLYPDRWMPVCNFLEFGLGIWIVQQNFYPKWTYDNSVIRFMADISFYVFLVQAFNNSVRVSLILYFVIVIVLSWLLMMGDNEIQRWLKKKLDFIFKDNKI